MQNLLEILENHSLLTNILPETETIHMKLMEMKLLSYSDKYTDLGENL